MRRRRVAGGVSAIVLALWLGGAAAEPIGSLHCNDANEVSRAVGQNVTVTGTVIGQFSTARTTRLYVQDRTGGVCVYGTPRNCAALGDSVRVTGRVASQGGLTQITGDRTTPLEIEPLGPATGHVIALALTVDEIRDTEQPYGCEPNESRLVLMRDVLVRTANGAFPAPGLKFTVDTSYRLAHAAADSATNWVLMRVTGTAACDATQTLVGQPVPIMPVQVTGVLSQLTGRSQIQGGYQVLPRTRADVGPGIGDYRDVPPPNR